MTPNDYLQRLRVTRARDLLVTTSQSVTDIAYATGFSSSQYFSNVFRKYAGTTPSTFRARATRTRR
jgi:transcriptional regulator GlxA family with amidase domain